MMGLSYFDIIPYGKGASMVLRKFCSAICLLMLAWLFCGSALGASEEGYVFTVTEEAVGLQIGNAEVLHGPTGVYRTDDPAVIQALDQAGLLEFCEEDGLIQLAETQTEEPTEDEYWVHSLLDYNCAAEQALTGQGVRICMIDSGLYTGFGAYTDAVIEPGANYLAEQTDAALRADTNDTYGHGTQVASIIADRQYGLAPLVTLIPLKCFDAKNSMLSPVVEAVYDAVDVYHCDILNLSLGATTEFETLKAAVQYALDHGVLVVCAAGNLRSGYTSSGNDAYYYPASQDGVISVGSATQSQTIATSSVQNDKVTVAAPGAALTARSINAGAYKTVNGTSFAAPVVSALAALAFSAEPDLEAQAFRDLLTATAVDLGAKGRDNAFGHGLVNICSLLTRLQQEEALFLFDQNTRTLSVHQAAQKQIYSAFLTFYDIHGKFLSTMFAENLTGHFYVDRLPLPEGTASYKLFTVDSGAAPLLPVQGNCLS